MNTRRYLFLQGPMGPFFKKLAAFLRKQGHYTLRINFNGGDRLHFSSRHATDYLGTLADWPAYIHSLIQTHQITDLVLYGDCRPLHQIAIEQARQNHLRTHVFEEGYFRPNWVTLEADGVNGFSRLPVDAAFYRALPEPPEFVQPPLYGSSFPRLVRHTISYYVASFILGWRYLHYKSHRPRTYQKEGPAWGLRLIENYLLTPFRLRRKRHALADPRPYFLVLLQLGGDSQITHHSRYNDMYEFLDELLSNFSKHAPPDIRLIVKNHPLDNGLARYRHFLRQKAHTLGLGDRLVYLDAGHLPTLLKSARGVVTVNSTGGLAAIYHQIPVKIFGRAVYAMAGLVDTQPLEQFWHHPQPPDETLFKRFRHYVLQHTQIHGSFYRREGMCDAVHDAAIRLGES